MGIKVKVSGASALIQGIEQYEREIQEKIQRELKAWAERTEAAAKRDVAVDTGALKSTIRTVLGADRLTWIVKAGNNNDVKYASYIEFGTGAKVDQSFLQQYGLVSYARQFKGNQDPFFPLPPRTFLFKNARIEFEKSLAEIKKIIATSWK